MNFYILSFEKQGKDPELCFWRADAKGYTTTLLDAGEYTREQVSEFKYHSGPNAVAIPTGALRLVTKNLKAFFEGGRMLPVVQVIPIPEAKSMLMENQLIGAVLMGKEGENWHWRVLTEKPRTA